MDNASALIQTHTNTDLGFATNGAGAQMVLQKSTGNVGIGIPAPSERLDVNGNVKVSGILKLSGGTPAVGKVLTSDAVGNASWQAASGAGWGLSGNAGTDTSANFIGTVDNKALRFRVFNQRFGLLDYTRDLVALGYNALPRGLGFYNVAIGSQALLENTSGNDNTAIGGFAMSANINGGQNTANGKNALRNNNSGSSNTAIGAESLSANTIGGNNTAVGYRALYSVNTFGSQNTAIGYLADVTVDGIYAATAIGYDAKVDADFKVRIGSTNVTSIGGQKSWTTFSDARFKRNIKNNVPGLSFITKLQPITYTVDVPGIDNYYAAESRSTLNRMDRVVDKTLKNPTAATDIQSGFLAQDVEKAAKELGYDFSGVDVPTNDKALYGLRYADFVVPMVKAIQEQQLQIETQQQTIELLKKRIDILEAK